MKRVIHMKLAAGAIVQPKAGPDGRPMFADGELVTETLDLSWSDKLREFVKSGVQERLSMADVIKMLEVWNAVKDAQDGQPLILEETAHQTLVLHLERLGFSGFHPGIAELLHAVREADEWTEAMEAVAEA